MKLTVNFSEVQARSVIPAGDVQCVIADAVLKEKAGSEYPYINVTLAVAEGDNEGRNLFAVLSFKPEALWKMMETFNNLGFSEEEYELEFDDQTSQLTSPEIIGLPCIAQVYNEPYNNRMTSKVSSILGPNGEGGVTAPPEETTKPATKQAGKPAGKPAAANGAKRSPFPAGKAAARSFK